MYFFFLESFFHQVKPKFNFFFFLHMDIRTCMSVNKQNLYYKQGLEPMVITKELLYLVLYNEKWICQLLWKALH